MGGFGGLEIARKGFWPATEYGSTGKTSPM